MIPYFVIFGLLAIFSLLDVLDGGKELKLRVFFFFFCVFFLFAAFRSGDQDYQNYVMAFKEVVYVNVLDADTMEGMGLYYMEPGFRILNKIVSCFTSNPFWIIAIAAFIALSLNFRCYLKYSPYILLTLLLYFCHTFLLREMIQIRSGIACAICLSAIPFVEKKQWGAFLLAVALAGMFHTISWAFLIVYPFYWFRFSRKMLARLLVICLVIAFVCPFGKLLSLLPPFPLFDKIMIYMHDTDHNQTLGVLTNPVIMKLLAVSCVGLFFYGHLCACSRHFRILFNMLVIGTCWMLVFNDFSIVAARVATLFTTSEVIIIPMFFWLLKENFFHKLVYWLVLCCYALATLSLNLYVENVLPYRLSLF